MPLFGAAAGEGGAWKLPARPLLLASSRYSPPAAAPTSLILLFGLAASGVVARFWAVSAPVLKPYVAAADESDLCGAQLGNKREREK